MRRQCVDDYDGPTLLGVDVSHWQGDINWRKVGLDSKAVTFAVVRSGDGLGRDRRWEDNLNDANDARDAGLVVGSYHYFRADRGGAEQAEIVAHMWESVGGFERGMCLPPVLDLEGGSRKNLTRGVFDGPDPNVPLDLVVEEAIEFLENIGDEFGVRPMIYTGQAFHWWLSQGRPDLAARFGVYPLWIVDYHPCPRMPVDNTGNGFPWERWQMWQYTSGGSVDGIDGNVDLNRFRGDAAALEIFLESGGMSACP